MKVLFRIGEIEVQSEWNSGGTARRIAEALPRLKGWKVRVEAAQSNRTHVPE